MKKILLISLALLGSLLIHPNVQAACTVTSGVTTLPVGDSCQTEPDSYGITLYQKWLCTARPTVPADGVEYDLSNCVQTMNTATGEVVRVTSTSSNVALTSPVTRPPVGVYTHGIMIFKNEFLLTANLVFNSARGDSQGVGSAVSGAVYCNTLNDSGAEDAGDSMVCDTSAGTAGEWGAILNNFNVGGSYEATANETFASGNRMDAYLLNTDSELADNASEAAAGAKMFGMQTFGTPVVVDKDTRGFNMSFNVSTGASIWQNGNSTYSIGSGPFQVLLTPVQY
jgi:hypothetical protein